MNRDAIQKSIELKRKVAISTQKLNTQIKKEEEAKQERAMSIELKINELVNRFDHTVNQRR